MKTRRLMATVLTIVSLFFAALPIQASTSTHQWVTLDYFSSSKDSYSRYGYDVYVNVQNMAAGSNRSNVYFEVVDAWNGVIDSGTVIPYYDYVNNLQSGDYYTSREYHFTDYAHPIQVVLYSTNGYGSEGEAYIEWVNP
ncbi:hypothetical protein WBG83_00065 [Paenibacillus sp. y28]